MRWNRSIIFLPLLAAGETAAHQPLDLATATVVDLTYPFEAKTLYWPSSPSGFELKELSSGPTPGGYFYSANLFTAPEHGGTHLDAPIHFFEKGLTVDRIPARHLVAPAVVIDVTARASANPDYRLTVEDLRAWEAANGPIQSGAIGVDTPSIDYGQSSDFIVHQIAAAAGVPGLENVANSPLLCNFISPMTLPRVATT